MKKETNSQTDKNQDTRSLIIYFGGLITVYIIAVITFWNVEEKDGAFIAIMFAPTVGALLAKFFSSSKIQFGRPGWWLFAGLIPVSVVLFFYYLGTWIGVDSLDPQILVLALITSPLAIFSASLTAVGEEIGWRGFLWPLLRKKRSFLQTAILVGAIWWLYHVPLILFGWYGTIGGLAAFTVGIVGFTLFVGVLTDRSRSLWPSVIAHGAWNGLVSTGFALSTKGGVPLQAFKGSTTWVGEFGWLAAIGSIVLGVAATIWHLNRSPDPSSD